MHPVLDTVAGGQEQHRHRVAGAAQRLQDAPAIERGQHHVEDDQVVVAAEREVQPVETVACQVDDETGFDQPLAQVIAGLRFVLDDQNLHVPCLTVKMAAATDESRSSRALSGARGKGRQAASG